MLWLAIGVLLFVVTFTATTLLGKIFINKNSELEEYTFKKDVYLYMFLMFLIGSIGIGFFLPHFHDFVVPLKILQIAGAFFFAAIIYLLFLLETKKLLDLAVFALSILSAFWFISKDSLAFSAFIPYQLEILGIGILVALFVLSAKILIALPSLYSSFISMVLIGLLLISLIGGLPSYVILFASLMLGAWIAVLQMNFFEFKFKINEGAVMSANFLLGAILLLGVNEFAAPSMLILVIYPLAELIWCVIADYILKRHVPDLYLNAAYYTAFEKGADLQTLRAFIFKLSVTNIALALFQLYAPNPFTLPFLGFLINFWLMAKLYNIDQPNQTLKQTNTQFMQDVKNEIENIKQTFKKD
ncbi:MAG: hypothetical protein IJ870_02210 [Alphaproteobacteria bacterium]|nr:hypothetical protein [Alphaproteobacteria bacterium]